LYAPERQATVTTEVTRAIHGAWDDFVVRVLVVEDEPALADSIARGLRDEGMAVDLALDGEQALARATINTYDVIVLDRDLPVVHGDDVCRQLVASGVETRIIMLTAARAVGDRIVGLTIGADDYLPKPFAFGELVARIRALARRPAAGIAPILTVGDLIVDPMRRVATRQGALVQLTRKEFGVLETLLSANGHIVSAEQLLERVWDEHADPFTHVVRMTIMKLRRKLGDPPVIETLPGEGYRVIA
jgi:DNA-binding response OmpR family regulator